jgi:hypothetical protein
VVIAAATTIRHPQDNASSLHELHCSGISNLYIACMTHYITIFSKALAFFGRFFLMPEELERESLAYYPPKQTQPQRQGKPN